MANDESTIRCAPSDGYSGMTGCLCDLETGNAAAAAAGADAVCFAFGLSVDDGDGVSFIFINFRPVSSPENSI